MTATAPPQPPEPPERHVRVEPPAVPQLSMTLRTFASEDLGGWSHLVERAALLDEAGVDRLVVSDHVVFGDDLDAYGDPRTGGVEGGRQPTGPDGHWLEPLTTLAFVAARTTTIRLGTNILLAALRRPAVLAKTAATLDVLSGGRVDLGVGVGWQAAEYEATGLDFAGRGRLLDHSLEVCQALWTETRASYASDELAFDGIHQMPKPAQPGGVPVWVSGTVNDRVVQRLARFGSGWIPWGRDADPRGDGLARMREALAAAGRDPAGLQVVGQLPVVRREDRLLDIDATMAGVPALVEAGFTDLRMALNLPDDPFEARDHLTVVVDAFRAAAGRPPVP